MRPIKYSKILILVFLQISISYSEDLNSASPDIVKVWAQNQSSFLIKNKQHIDDLINKVDKIKGIELIVAGPMHQHIESSFGHALLRFVETDGDAIQDSILSFVALIDEPVLNYKKGIMGGYPVIAQVGSFGEFIQTYLETEERPLDRYIIPTDAKIRKNIVETLKKWLSKPGGMGGYKFLSNNCAGVLVEFLKQSGLSTGFQAPVPSLLPAQMKSRYLTPYPVIRTFTIAPIFEKLAYEFNVKVEILKAGNWPREAINRFKSIPPSALAQLYFRASPIDEEVRSAMQSLILKNGPLDLANVYGIKKIPNVIYELCYSIDCAAKIVTILRDKTIFGEKSDLSRRVTEYARLNINSQMPWLDQVLRKYIQHSRLIQSADSLF
ncbi:MAG: hypothetical protein B7Y39_17975 [Bdellovibrio sp. 28-41-41]|nr:MAG: hypothetical protein B7Y39_17975 [Bdellovibrio sp. 28-41-41]